MKSYVIFLIVGIVAVVLLVWHLAFGKGLDEKKADFKINCDKIFGPGNSVVECSKSKCKCYPASCMNKDLPISYQQCLDYLNKYKSEGG